MEQLKFCKPEHSPDGSPFLHNLMLHRENIQEVGKGLDRTQLSSAQLRKEKTVTDTLGKNIFASLFHSPHH